MAAARLLTWTLCVLVAVYLSSQEFVVQGVRLLLETYHIPAGLVLLPVSLTAAWCVAQIILYIIGIPRISPRGKAVFITGCDSGFGHHLALRMTSKGYKVFAGCLFPNGDGAKQLLDKTCSTESGQGGVTVVPCDVTSDQSLTEAVDLVTRSLRGNQELWAVVANAGLGGYGYLEWVSTEKVQKLFDVNVFGVLRTFKAFAPLLRKSKGRLVVTNSYAARFSPPTLVPYSMSKHAALALCDGLRAEMAAFGVHVVSIEPNMYRTSMIPTTTKDLDVQWESLTEEQRLSYGPKLLKKSRIMTQDFAYLCQDNLDFPLSCFEHAISARYPKDCYQADRMIMYVTQKILLCLPFEFMSFYNKYIHCLLIVGRNLLPGKYSP